MSLRYHAPMPAQRPSPWRRLAAYAIDYVLIAGYIGALYGVVTLIRDAPMALDPMLGHAVGMATLSLPIALYFAVMEASSRAGTIGKRVMKLRVVTVDGHRARFSRTFVRAVVKLIPWEIAHAALWRIPGWPSEPADPLVWQWVAFATSLGACAWFVASLFTRAGHTPYDIASRTRIENADAKPGAGG